MMPRPLGQLVLGLSGLGFPLAQLLMRRFGARGAIAVEAVCVGLLVRDVAMLASGAPSRLRRGPAILLWMETAIGAAAVLTGLPPLLDVTARQQASAPRPTGSEALRRTAIGALFGLHTLRFRIYLQPDHGLR
jgi:hypothetical protein